MKPPSRWVHVCILLGLWALLYASAFAQATPFTLTANSLREGKAVELDKPGWKYTPGDEPRFADPQFDDRAWETLPGTAITLDSIPKRGWHGSGWFRLRLQVDPALANQPLALVMVHYGASEIFLDGKLVERFGMVGTTPETEVVYNPNTLPINIVLDARGEHVLAVRHSCMEMRDMSSGWGKWIARQSARPVVSAYANRTNNYGAGFGVWLVEAGQARDDQVTRRKAGGLYLLNFGLLLAIGLLHLLLFWFYPSQRANLFFGLFACSSAASNIIYYRWSLSHQSATGILLQNGANNTLSFLALGTLLAFMYTAFAECIPKGRWPKWFWLWVMAAALYIPMNSIFVGLAETRYWYLYIQALTWFPVIEVGRGMSLPVKNKVSGAWIVGAGMLGYTLYMALNVLILVRGLSGANFSIAIRSVVILFLTGAVSIFLARQFARTNLNLEEQLVQVNQLSAAALEHEKVKAENDRRAAELEEARQLQLSMLPKKLPNLPYLDIAAYMKTASEIGGDYYDFHLGEDGTLTIAVGDATGHGLKAGTLVASIKSLFVSLAYHSDIPHIFHRMSRVLKEMKLRGLFMAMTMVKVQDQQLSVCIAGMPSVLIYRAATGEVEEVPIKAVPLGSLANYQYQQRELTLAGGDVIVLLSDGLLERFNPQQEMFEEARTKAALCACAQTAPATIIEQLVKAGEDWAAGQTQDDDVTLVVVKMR
ncbi:MAG: PP2C family protein-serine/threonine phosphatase [Acidobacteria bacterium]|nr:PP2C family protein-serine/threonine phosphatase [Acidobacteriota bacterium]